MLLWITNLLWRRVFQQIFFGFRKKPIHPEVHSHLWQASLSLIPCTAPLVTLWSGSSPTDGLKPVPLDKGPESRSFPAAGAYMPVNTVCLQRGKEGGGLGCSPVTAHQRFQVSLFFADSLLPLLAMLFPFIPSQVTERCSKISSF